MAARLRHGSSRALTKKRGDDPIDPHLSATSRRSLSDARRFVGWLLEHLQSCGASLTGSRIQTDNGSEFIGSWQAQSDSAFTRCVQAAGLRHQTIPPGAHTWQADVETAHRLIEDEFYQVESFQGRSDFLIKAATYNLWFNVQRQNSYQGDRSPWDILHARDPTLPPKIVAYPTLFLDEFFDPTLPSEGYDVIPYPSRLCRPFRHGGAQKRRMRTWLDDQGGELEHRQAREAVARTSADGS